MSEERFWTRAHIVSAAARWEFERQALEHEIRESVPNEPYDAEFDALVDRAKDLSLVVAVLTREAESMATEEAPR